MLRMEDTRAVSGWMGSQEALMGRVLTVDEVVHNVRQVTGEEVARVADDLLSTEKLNLALVGPCRGRKRLERLLHL
jgi:predicted Zn-dependent peptidase